MFALCAISLCEKTFITLKILRLNSKYKTCNIAGNLKHPNMLSIICKKKCYDLLDSITCTILTTITMHTCLPYMYTVYFGLGIEHNVRQTVGYEQALNRDSRFA